MYHVCCIIISHHIVLQCSVVYFIASFVWACEDEDENEDEGQVR